MFSFSASNNYTCTPTYATQTIEGMHSLGILRICRLSGTRVYVDRERGGRHKKLDVLFGHVFPFLSMDVSVHGVVESFRSESRDPRPGSEAHHLPGGVSASLDDSEACVDQPNGKHRRPLLQTTSTDRETARERERATWALPCIANTPHLERRCLLIHTLGPEIRHALLVSL